MTAPSAPSAPSVPDSDLVLRVRRVAGEHALDTVAMPRTISVRDPKTGRYPLPPATGTSIADRKNAIGRVLARVAQVFGLEEKS